MNKDKRDVAIVKWLPYREARNFVRKLKLKNLEEWQEYCRSGRKPDNISTNPPLVYKNKGWVNWGDFLSGKNVKTRSFIPFVILREYVRKFKFSSTESYQKFSKTKKFSLNIPRDPAQVYKGKGWTSWGDFLGDNGSQNSNVLMSFEEVKQYVQKLGLKTKEEWDNHCSDLDVRRLILVGSVEEAIEEAHKFLFLSSEEREKWNTLLFKLSKISQDKE